MTPASLGGSIGSSEGFACDSETRPVRGVAIRDCQHGDQEEGEIRAVAKTGVKVFYENNRSIVVLGDQKASG